MKTLFAVVIWAMTACVAAGRAGAEAVGDVPGHSAYVTEQMVVNAGSIADTEALPLIVVMHWMASDPDEMRSYLQGLKQPARIVFLKGRYPSRGKFSFFPVEGENYYRLPADQQRAIIVREAEQIAAELTTLGARYPRAPKPVVIGASQGGDLSYVLAIRHGQQVGLAVPLLATLDAVLVQAPVDPGLPVRVYHGEKDPIVAVNRAREHVEQLLEAGFRDVKLQEYPGVGHDISPAMRADYLRVIDDWILQASQDRK